LLYKYVKNKKYFINYIIRNRKSEEEEEEQEEETESREEMGKLKKMRAAER